MSTPTNAQRRTQILAAIEVELKQLLPDEEPCPVRSFDDLEAVAVRAGDSVACQMMAQTVQSLYALPQCTKQGRCKCGRQLLWSEKPRTLETIRGPVTVTRLHGYCRVCQRGFFPLGRGAGAAAARAERPLATGLERIGQRC